MIDELVDVLDEKGNLTGKTISRNLAHKTGVWHATAHIWIYNSKGEVLIQRRSSKTFVYPSLWDISCAGHVPSGEDPKEAARRELSEELGLNVSFNELKRVRIQKQSYKISSIPWFNNNEFNNIYLLRFDGDLTALKLQKEEVGGVKFMPLDTFANEIKTPKLAKNYVPHNYYPLIIDAIRQANT